MENRKLEDREKAVPVIPKAEGGKCRPDLTNNNTSVLCGID